jgi:hypothetical protein
MRRRRSPVNYRAVEREEAFLHAFLNEPTENESRQLNQKPTEIYSRSHRTGGWWAP